MHALTEPWRRLIVSCEPVFSTAESFVSFCNGWQAMNNLRKAVSTAALKIKIDARLAEINNYTSESSHFMDCRQRCSRPFNFGRTLCACARGL